MMKGFRKIPSLVWLGIGAYLVFLVAGFPAAQAYALVKKIAPDAPLVLKGVQGTLWNGSAAQAYAGGQMLSSLEWQLSPLWLLAGRLQTDLGLRYGESYFYGQLGRSLAGSLYLDEVEARLVVGDIQPLSKAVPANLQGVLSLKLDELSFEDHLVTAARGVVAWQDAALKITQPVQLGHLKLDLETTGEGVKGTLSDGGGALTADGVLNLGLDGSWQFAGNFSARDRGQAGLTQALGFMGRPGPDGRISVSRSGKLSDLGGPFALPAESE